MIHQPDPVTGPQEVDSENLPLSPPEWQEASGSGTHWGLLILGVILLLLAANGVGGYLIAIPDWVPNLILIGGGLILVLVFARDWMARRKR